MIKRFTFIICFALALNWSFAQNKQIVSLTHQLTIANDDTSRVLIMAELSSMYQSLSGDSAFAIAQRAVELSQRINFPKGEVRSLIILANAIDSKGDLANALELNFRGLAIAEDNQLLLEKSMCLTNIGDIYWDLTDFPRAISFYQQANRINEAIKNQPGTAHWRTIAEQDLGAVFMLNDQLDSAFVYLQRVYNETLDDTDLHAAALMFFGDLQFRMGKRNTGLTQLRQSIDLLQKKGDHYSLADACRFISECFREMNMVDSSIYYAKKGLTEAQLIGYKSPILYTSRILAELYESKDNMQALYYRKVYDTANDIYYGPNKVKNLQKTLSDEQERQRKIESERVAYQNKLKQYALLIGSGILLFIGLILYRNNLRERKAKIELREKNNIIEQALADLKSTQSQLIQSEKMASLGELTAGIAHEIQNPLNFVNNFSEVNRELASELVDEVDKGNIDEVKAIANDIKDNSEKINYHGKRADTIVKGMLQHSRSGTGIKEPTDINKLADEYLRLAYHGLKAKDKEFNATMKTDFDETIGNISIIPQEIGRVMLNLYTNAFYAVSEKKKSADTGYEPTVSVLTKLITPPSSGMGVSIIVSDNGNGISKKILDKIFQPFFTTKPTGQGTGLGLSLSYDIIKAHGGEIKVSTKEGEGTEFIILL